MLFEKTAFFLKTAKNFHDKDFIEANILKTIRQVLEGIHWHI